jgi:signal transduction histidine kinase
MRSRRRNLEARVDLARGGARGTRARGERRRWSGKTPSTTRAFVHGQSASHAEIGEKHGSIRRANELKARLVGNVSHELRTPINSILGLTRLLLGRAEGELNAEQDEQLAFVK